MEQNFPVEISLSPLDTEEGPLVANAIRDITERKNSDAERTRLLRERAAHVETNRIKDEFLATIEPNAKAQAQLIEDLLDLSRVITGKLRIALAPVDVTAVVDAAVDVVRPTAQARGMVLEVIAVQRPVFILGDGDRLQQAVWNLLTNALKFTPDGGRVEVRVRVDDSTAGITVRDTGRGIDPAFLPHVFDRFRQQDGSTRENTGGLGLGLALVVETADSAGTALCIVESMAA